MAMPGMGNQGALQLGGDRETGQDVRTQNVTAIMAIANIVKSSLGPVGLDKMLVDDLGEVTITNDGATILNQLEVEHPAARVLVQLSEMQDKEVGDGTTSVVILAAELLKRANELVKNSKTQADLTALESNVRQSFKVGKLNLVDLAGSERVRLSGATGQRLEESKKINPSDRIMV